jgi:acyl-CoA synthetase (AMP-forming)/AMP-acid ligase II
MNIATLLQTQARLRPHTPALLETIRGRNRSTSFAQLELQVGQVATFLHQQGLQAGDPVLVFYPMSAELYIILGALFRLGLIAMFLDPNAGRNHFDRCCTLCPPRGMIASSQAYWLAVRSPALQHIPLKVAIGLPLPGTISWYRCQKLPCYDQIAPCTADSPALLTFTSGSTGQPKPVLRTHGFLLEQYRVLVNHLQLTPDQVEMTSLPIFVLANLATGTTTLIPTGNLRSPAAIATVPILRQLAEHQPQRILASPALLERLVEGGQQPHLAFSRVQQIISGGGPIMPRLLHQLQQVAPQAQITLLYGSTEAEPIALIQHTQIQPTDLHQMQSGAGLLAGQPIPEIHLQILRPDDLSQTYTSDQFAVACLPPYQVGEIVVSGAHVLSGYWNGQGNSETKFRVGDAIWHRTGDAGYRDAGDRLWLVGRCQACIQDAKGSLYPFAVECVLQQHPQVQRSTVVLHQGQRLLLVEPVHSQTPLNVAEIQELVKWAAIDDIRVLPKIPVDDRHNSKIAYPALMKQIVSQSSIPCKGVAFGQRISPGTER